MLNVVRGVEESEGVLVSSFYVTNRDRGTELKKLDGESSQPTIGFKCETCAGQKLVSRTAIELP